jgi:hypothetical protein
MDRRPGMAPPSSRECEAAARRRPGRHETIATIVRLGAELRALAALGAPSPREGTDVVAMLAKAVAGASIGANFALTAGSRYGIEVYGIAERVKATGELITAGELEPAAFEIDEVLPQLGIALELGLTCAIFCVLLALADRAAEILQQRSGS